MDMLFQGVGVGRRVLERAGQAPSYSVVGIWLTRSSDRPAEAIAGGHAASSGIGDFQKEETGDRKRQANRDKRLAKAKRIKMDREELEKFRHWGQGEGSGGAAKEVERGRRKISLETRFASPSHQGQELVGPWR